MFKFVNALRKFCVYSVAICFSPAVFATDLTNATTIGEAAEGLLSPVNFLNNLMGWASIIIGVAFIFGSFLRYTQYRVNPLAAPLSTVVLLLIFGIVLLCLPFAYVLTGGVPFPAP